MAHDKDHSKERKLPDVSHIQNEDVSYERSDVKIRPIVLFLFWLTVGAIVIHLLMAGLYKILDNREKERQGSPLPMAAERKVIPPEPRLQLAPAEPGQPAPRFIDDHPLNDIKKLRADEDAKLNSYQADTNTGMARIPIEAAKELLIQNAASSKQAQAGASGEMNHGTEPLPSIKDQRPSRANSGRGMVSPKPAGAPAHEAPQH